MGVADTDSYIQDISPPKLWKETERKNKIPWGWNINFVLLQQAADREEKWFLHKGELLYAQPWVQGRKNAGSGDPWDTVHQNTSQKTFDTRASHVLNYPRKLRSLGFYRAAIMTRQLSLPWYGISGL